MGMGDCYGRGQDEPDIRGTLMTDGKDILFRRPDGRVKRWIPGDVWTITHPLLGTLCEIEIRVLPVAEATLQPGDGAYSSAGNQEQ